MPTILYEFSRNNDREVVRACFQRHDGREVADVRVWMPPHSDGVLVPSPKGSSLDRALLPHLEEAVRALRAADRHAAEEPV